MSAASPIRSIHELLRRASTGNLFDPAGLTARVTNAVAEVVRKQAEWCIDIVSDGEMSKTSVIAHVDERPVAVHV